MARTLVNAPNIGINADGSEAIAYGYMNAAGIPDSTGKAWSGTSPDVMAPAAVAGATTTDHRDGKLWGPTRQPRYCQLMSMHWNVSRDATSNEAIAEMSEYLLNYPVHLFAECQAVNQLEDAPAGHFVTTDNGTGAPTTSVACGTNTTPNNGLCAKKPTPALPLEFLNSDLAFAQMDGPFKTVGGSEPAYGLAPGSSYYDQGIVMIREQNVANGMNGKSDLWMTGFANFAGSICTISESGTTCRSRGKVSYLGGHQYSVKTPISMNGDSQGTRLFLNSLFEAECVTAQGAANVGVTASAPAYTANPLVTFQLDWNNAGAGVAVGARLTDTLPAGVTFVSATAGGVFSMGKVVWDLSDLGPGATGSVQVTASLPSYGSYSNSAVVTYKVGNNSKTNASNTTTTIYTADIPDAGTDAGTQPDGGGNACASVTCPGRRRPIPARWARATRPTAVAASPTSPTARRATTATSAPQAPPARRAAAAAARPSDARNRRTPVSTPPASSARAASSRPSATAPRVRPETNASSDSRASAVSAAAGRRAGACLLPRRARSRPATRRRAVASRRATTAPRATTGTSARPPPPAPPGSARAGRTARCQPAAAWSASAARTDARRRSPRRERIRAAIAPRSAAARVAVTAPGIAPPVREAAEPEGPAARAAARRVATRAWAACLEPRAPAARRAPVGSGAGRLARPVLAELAAGARAAARRARVARAAARRVEPGPERAAAPCRVLAGPAAARRRTAVARRAAPAEARARRARVVAATAARPTAAPPRTHPRADAAASSPPREAPVRRRYSPGC